MRKATAKQVKKSRIRSIVLGKRYDIVGGLRRFTRAVEKGDHGDIREVMIIAKQMSPHPNARPNILAFGYGSESDMEQYFMVATVKHRLEPL